MFEALDAARAGRSLPPPPRQPAIGIADRGSEVDAAGALSVLLPHIGPEERRALVRGAR